MKRYLKKSEHLVIVRKSDHSIYKQASIKTKKEAIRQRIKEEDKQAQERYCDINKEEYKWGIFWEKGYRAIKVFKTKEDAEKYLSFQKAKKDMVIREIIGW